MTKKSLICIFLLCFIFVPSIHAANNGQITTSINDVNVLFDISPIQENGVTLVPFRKVFNELGYSVKWDTRTSTITSTRNDTEIKLTLNSKTAYINSQKNTLTVAPKIINGQTFVPLRFVTEASGAKVEWNQKNKHINIYDQSIVMKADPYMINRIGDKRLDVVSKIEGEAYIDQTYLKLSNYETYYYDHVFISGLSGFKEFTFEKDKLKSYYYIVYSDKFDELLLEYSLQLKRLSKYYDVPTDIEDTFIKSNESPSGNLDTIKNLNINSKRDMVLYGFGSYKFEMTNTSSIFLMYSLLEDTFALMIGYY